MSTYKNLVIGLGLKWMESKDDPHGMIKELKTFKHVNNTENVLADVTAFNEIRTLYKTLYGDHVARLVHIDTFTDFDLCALFAKEITPTDKHIIDDDSMIKDRATGRIVGLGMRDASNNMHYFKCNNAKLDKDRRIVFGKKTFRQFFYAIADHRKGFHTGSRIDANIAYSARKNLDGTLKLYMAPLKGGTSVTAS